MTGRLRRTFNRLTRPKPEDQALGAITADVNVAELRAAITQLLDAVEAKFGPELHLPDDQYWNVPFSEATQVYFEPKLDMGSVMDDPASVREFISREDPEFVSIWHEADHVAGVLRSIARLDSPNRR